MSRISGLDAALLFDESRAYLFRGDKYVRYNVASGSAEPNYPRLISSAWKGVPFRSGFDAAVNWGNGKAYIFKGSQYLRYDLSEGSMDAGYPRPISSAWKGMSFTGGVDAVVNFGNGKAYFFKGNKYIRYDVESGKADAGYPKLISSAWKGMSFIDGVDTAFHLGNGKVYFFKGEQYIRYDIAAGKADPGYPVRCDLPDRWKEVDFQGLWHNGLSTWELRSELSKLRARALKAANSKMVARIDKLLRPSTLEFLVRNGIPLMDEAGRLGLTLKSTDLHTASYWAAPDGPAMGTDPIFSGGGVRVGILDVAPMFSKTDTPHNTAAENIYEGPDLLPNDLKISDTAGCLGVAGVAVAIVSPAAPGALALGAAALEYMGSCLTLKALVNEVMK